MAENSSNEKDLLKMSLAAAAANAKQLQDLRSEQKRIATQLDVAQRQSAERSFAHWRQTEDGRFYEAWKKKTKPRIHFILKAERAWVDSYQKLIENALEPEEKVALKTGDYIPAPYKHRYVKMSLAAALGAVVVSFVTAFLLDVEEQSPIVLLVFWGSLLSASCIALAGRKLNFWVEANDEARLRFNNELARRLNVTPSELASGAPKIFRNSEATLALRAANLIANEVTHHPLPEELFDIPEPQLISEEENPFEQLNGILKLIRKQPAV